MGHNDLPYDSGYDHGRNTQLDRLARKLNDQRKKYLPASLVSPVNSSERELRDEAVGALKAIEAIASEMGLKTRTEYYN